MLIYALGAGIVSAISFYVVTNGPTRSAPTWSSAPLSPTHFTPATLTASTSCTPFTKLLTFSLPHHLVPEANTRTSPVFSIYVKDSDIQVERPYTPLEGIDAQGKMRFWVKRYQGGEVGRWLHERKVGDQIEMRGPIPNWTWQDGEWDEIVMISGGTGITPFFQLMHNVFGRISEGALPHTRFTLLHSSPTPVDLPPGMILDPLRSFAQLHPDLFSLHLHVDTADLKVSGQNPHSYTIGRIDRKFLERALACRSPTPDSWWRKWLTLSRRPNVPERKILFLVCGPEPMIAALAGPRARNMTQGHVGGVLGEMGYGSDRVYKL